MARDFMTATPLVSIIIPTYNRAELIGETIASVLAQNYENWQCVIVDDGSTDGTLESIIAQFAGDPRFVITFNKRKKGACGARNTGVELAEGEYLIFLDADDLLSETCLSVRVYTFLQDTSYDFLVFSTIEFKNNRCDTNILLNVCTTDDVIERFINLDVPWLSTGPIWKKESFQKLGYWNEEILSWQDWELHLRALLNKYHFRHFSLVDNYWRFHDDIDSIGKKSIGIDHRKSVLESALSLKAAAKENPLYVARINGLIYWIAERFLEFGKKKLALRTMLLSHEQLPFLNKVMNSYGIYFKKALLIKHPYMPTYGTMRKVKACDLNEIQNIIKEEASA